MAKYLDFYDLDVYKECRKFRKKCSTVIKAFIPEKEKFLLKPQLLDASRSITANIAEGHGRAYYQDNIRFCRIFERLIKRMFRSFNNRLRR